MPTDPVRLVSNPNQVRDSHQAYRQAVMNAAADARQVLLDAMPYAQNWIVIRDDDGHFLFAPSKFCGYYAMDAETYRQHYHTMDGRMTERVLAPWVHLMDQDETEHSDARDALFAFCGQFSKKPNGRCRISLLPGAGAPAEAADNRHTVLAELLVAVFKSLPQQQQRMVAQQIGAR